MTVWDVTDNDSWIVTGLHDVGDPTMFDGAYNKNDFYVNGTDDAMVRPK
jgi:hypothetical protein